MFLNPNFKTKDLPDALSLATILSGISSFIKTHSPRCNRREDPKDGASLAKEGASLEEIVRSQKVFFLIKGCAVVEIIKTDFRL